MQKVQKITQTNVWLDYTHIKIRREYIPIYNSLRSRKRHQNNITDNIMQIRSSIFEMDQKIIAQFYNIIKRIFFGIQLSQFSSITMCIIFISKFCSLSQIIIFILETLMYQELPLSNIWIDRMHGIPDKTQPIHIFFDRNIYILQMDKIRWEMGFQKTIEGNILITSRIYPKKLSNIMGRYYVFLHISKQRHLRRSYFISNFRIAKIRNQKQTQKSGLSFLSFFISIITFIWRQSIYIHLIQRHNKKTTDKENRLYVL